MCFVNSKCLDNVKELKEDLLNKVKFFPSLNNQDMNWINMFIIYITLVANDIDLRIQKSLLKEMQLMLDGGFGNLSILDSKKFRSLYIAKVYETKVELQLDNGDVEFRVNTIVLNR